MCGACSTFTLLQSRSMSSAISSGIAVIVPCPISEPGETSVTVPSAATRIHALGEKLADCASALRRPAVPPNATATPMPPAVTMKERREMPWKQTSSNDSIFSIGAFMAASSCFLRGLLHRGDDLVVAAAATDVARHMGGNLRRRRLLVLGQQRRRLHDLPRRAVAALERVVGEESFLQRVVALRGQALDGGDVLADHCRERGGARAGRVAVYMGGTSAARGEPTA